MFARVMSNIELLQSLSMRTKGHNVKDARKELTEWYEDNLKRFTMIKLLIR